MAASHAERPDMTDDLEFRIARLRLEPGDVLVARVKGTASAEICHSVYNHVSSVIGDGRVLVVDERIDFSVLSAAAWAVRR